MGRADALLRPATALDTDAVLHLWAGLFDDAPQSPGDDWSGRARAWIERSAIAASGVRLPVIEVAGEVVAAAAGSLELGVPNPWCVHGRSVRLENVFTLPAHRGRGYGTMLVLDLVNWAREIGADRVDLSATETGERLYERIGFTRTSAPRMKLVL